jgi:hypothetical protein
MTKAKEDFEKKVDGQEGIDPVELNDLRKAKEDKAEEIKELANGSSWWLPDKTDIFEKGDNRNEVKLKDAAEEKAVEDITIRGIVPLATVLNEKNTYKGEKYLLKYVNIDTGEVEFTPLRGNLTNALIRETPLTEDLLNRETNFEKDVQKKSAVIVKYWGAIYNQENDQSYHSYTVKPL